MISDEAPSFSQRPSWGSSALHSRINSKTSATAEGGSKKRHSYKPLPTEFRRDGLDYRQIAREEDSAITNTGGPGVPTRAFPTR